MTPRQRALAMYAAVASQCGHVAAGRCEQCEITLRSCVTDLASEAVEECESVDVMTAREAARRFIAEVSRG